MSSDKPTAHQFIGPARRRGRATGLTIGAVLAALGPLPTWADLASADAALEEVMVTAQRREQNIMDVPLSVASYSPAQLDQQGIHQIDDLSRLTPSLHFTRTSGVSGNNSADISIRGIASDVGSATTAIYIDDTPIQIRSVGYFGGNAYPLVFDLERVEVLRGPQGTLFGAGAEGGAVRFLTPQPNFTQSSLSARTEVASIKNGSTTYEAGVAGGTPISDTLALRGSVWYRHEGGYIDRYNPTFTTRLEKGINDSDNYSGRLALGWRPTDALTVTPSLYYQKVESNGRPQYWQPNSGTGGTDYVTGVYNEEPSTDKFYLPAIKVEYNFGRIDLISNTSYFDRDQSQAVDYTTFLTTLRTGNPFGTYANKDTSNAVAYQTMNQRNFVQEVRLQSVSDAQLVDWTTGVFYSSTKQQQTNMSGSGRIPGVISSGFPQYLGRFNLYDDIHATDKQTAAFASLDIKPTQRLTATAALRVSRNEFDFEEVRDGPVNSGVRTLSNASQSDTAVTPKVGVAFKIDRNNMLYASASKGFRPGGAQAPVDPTFCARDLATLGLTQSPREYDSDSLWSYEAGSKNQLLGGALTLDANAYYVKWSDIQQSVRLPTCSFSYIANLGKATGKGVDVSVAIKPLSMLQVGASVGYNDTTFDDQVIGGNGVVLKQGGDRIGGPKWTGAIYGLGEASLSGAVDGYLRVDYSFQSSGIPPNPSTFGYDPGLTTLPATNQLSTRVGAKFSSVDVSLFVNNLTDSNDPLARSHDATGSPLYYVQSYQPRTIGLTAQWRY
jgi:outer membrane receptor protein involved in Fe transport